MLLENLQLDKSDLPQLEEVTYTEHPKDYRDLRLLVLMIFMVLLSAIWIIPLILWKLEVMGVLFGVWTTILTFFLVEEIKGFKKRGYVLRQRDITYKRDFYFILKPQFLLTEFNIVKHHRGLCHAHLD